MSKLDIPEYRAWCSMRRACYTPSDSAYGRVGAHGIKACAEWDSYERFVSDMGAKPVGYELIRIDHKKDYGPGNCKWGTHSEVMLNRPKLRRYRVGDKWCNLTQLTHIDGVKAATIYRRIKRRKETAEQAAVGVHRPVHKPPLMDINTVPCTCDLIDEPNPLRHRSHQVPGMKGTQCTRFRTAYQRMRRERQRQNG